MWDPDDNGPTPSMVVAGGNFINAGTNHLGFVAAWNGSTWQSLGGGVNGTVESITLFDSDGSGPLLPELVIAGDFGSSGSTNLNRIASYRNGQWTPFGSGVGTTTIEFINTLAAYGTDLAVGGVFGTAGDIPVQGLALWSGSSWRAFSDEHAAAPDTFNVFDGKLYAGGRFLVPGGGLNYTGILRWDSPTWVQPAPVQPNDDVLALAMFRGQLIAGGDYTNIGSHIAALVNGSWQPVGLGLNGSVYALCVWDPDGPGPLPDLLIAGGSFTTAGGQPARGIAAWDGASWSPLGSGTTGKVRALTVWNNQLVVAGDFFTAGGLVSPGMAFYGCPQTPCYANCDLSTAAPILNVNDFQCFLNKFAAADATANCDGSTAAPMLNVNDFQCFLGKFAAGCP